MVTPAKNTSRKAKANFHFSALFMQELTLNGGIGDGVLVVLREGPPRVVVELLIRGGTGQDEHGQGDHASPSQESRQVGDVVPRRLAGAPDESTRVSNPKGASSAEGRSAFAAERSRRSNLGRPFIDSPSR